MSLDARARWLMIALMMVLDALWLPLAGIGLADATLLNHAGGRALLAALALIYSVARPRPRLADLAHTALQLLMLVMAAAVLSYAATAAAQPLIDDNLAAADRVLGFDWLAWFFLVQAHPLLHAVLRLAYMSVLPQLAAAVVYLALSGQPARNSELVWTVGLSLAIIIPISGLLPAASAWVYYDVTNLISAVHLPDFTALRAGTMQRIDLGHLEGLITFPSFHTTLAILLPYALRRDRAVFAAALALNGVMLLAVPSEGGHYLGDVLAGAAVAWLAIIAAARIEARLSAAATVPNAVAAE